MHLLTTQPGHPLLKLAERVPWWKLKGSFHRCIRLLAQGFRANHYDSWQDCVS